MDLGNFKETLTHKYGPLPGYIWVGIGTGAIVVIATMSKGKSGSLNGKSVSVSPLSVGGLNSGSDGGGGGGGLDTTGGANDGSIIGGDGGAFQSAPEPLPVTQGGSTAAVVTTADGSSGSTVSAPVDGSTSLLTVQAQALPPTTDPAIVAAVQAASGGPYIDGSALTDTTDRAIARHIIEATASAPIATAPAVSAPTAIQVAPTPSQVAALESAAHAAAVKAAGSWTAGF